MVVLSGVANVEDIESNFMSFANFTQYIYYRNLTILEIELHSRRPFDTHFVFFRSLGESFKSTFYNETREFISINLCEDGIDVCETTVSDPAFLSVQQIVLPVSGENRAHSVVVVGWSN